MDTEIQNSKWVMVRQKLWILSPLVAIGVGVWLIYGVSTVVTLKNEVAAKDEKVAKLEEVLGLRNELYTNTPTELGLIASFGGVTASTTFSVNVETIVPPSPEIAKRIEKGEKPKLETKKEVKNVSITEQTEFPIKKLSEFRTGELVKIVYRTEPASGVAITAIRVEPYVVEVPQVAPPASKK